MVKLGYEMEVEDTEWNPEKGTCGQKTKSISWYFLSLIPLLAEQVFPFL